MTAPNIPIGHRLIINCKSIDVKSNRKGLTEYTLMRQLRLFDCVLIDVGGSIRVGNVELITLRGVGVYSEDRQYFVKWANVIAKEYIP